MGKGTDEPFPHGEYHIYTTAAGISKRHVHLTPDIISEAERLHALPYPDDIEDDWQATHQLKVGDNVWLTVGEGPTHYRYPELTTYGYEGAESCRAGDFEEPVFFESMIFHKCTQRPSRRFDPDWDIDDIREWVAPEHRDAFDQELESYLSRTDRVLPNDSEDEP